MAALPNRYEHPEDEDEDDDADMDEWMDMSETQRQHELDSALLQLEETLSRLTPSQLFASRRRSTLRSCIGWRNIIRMDFVPELAREHLRQAQVRLVKLRIMRSTGTYPGAA